MVHPNKQAVVAASVLNLWTNAVHCLASRCCLRPMTFIIPLSRFDPTITNIARACPSKCTNAVSSMTGPSLSMMHGCSGLTSEQLCVTQNPICNCNGVVSSHDAIELMSSNYQHRIIVIESLSH